MIGRFSRILVVDGNVASRSTTNAILRALGYESIDFAGDSQTAIRMIGRQQYRLILADWDRAPVSGADILRQTRINKRLTTLPFLMGIDRWQRKFIEIVREDGAILYLIKPFSADILCERIAQVSRDADQIGTVDLARHPPPERVLARDPTSIPRLWQLLRPDP